MLDDDSVLVNDTFIESLAAVCASTKPNEILVYQVDLVMTISLLYHNSTSESLVTLL